MQRRAHVVIRHPDLVAGADGVGHGDRARFRLRAETLADELRLLSMVKVMSLPAAVTVSVLPLTAFTVPEIFIVFVLVGALVTASSRPARPAHSAAIAMR